MRRRTIVLTLAALASFWGASIALAQSPPAEESSGQETDELVLEYQGYLQDDQGQPISGIFHFNFKLFEDEDGDTPVWEEAQHVAVVQGTYTVPLGESEKITRVDLPESPWIAVDWVGQGEILRDQFHVSEAPAQAVAPGAAEEPKQSSAEVKLSKETRELLEAAKSGKKVTFADVAERAVAADSAESALSAERLGDMSAAELKRATQLALDRLGDHIADPNAHSATGGLGLGTEQAVQQRIGGAGGDPYQVNCPPGYVVTGIKGGAGKMIDSISIVCSQLR